MGRRGHIDTFSPLQLVLVLWLFLREISRPWRLPSPGVWLSLSSRKATTDKNHKRKEATSLVSAQPTRRRRTHVLASPPASFIWRKAQKTKRATSAQKEERSPALTLLFSLAVPVPVAEFVGITHSQGHDFTTSRFLQYHAVIPIPFQALVLLCLPKFIASFKLRKKTRFPPKNGCVFALSLLLRDTLPLFVCLFFSLTPPWCQHFLVHTDQKHQRLHKRPLPLHKDIHTIQACRLLSVALVCWGGCCFLPPKKNTEKKRRE